MIFGVLEKGEKVRYQFICFIYLLAFVKQEREQEWKNKNAMTDDRQR